MQFFRKIFSNKVQSCIFCQIVEEKKTNLYFQDKEFLVFDDINKASAQEHILIITRDHILSALQVKDPKIIQRMQELGEKILTDISEKKGYKDNRFRFGFHLPPANSIDHIHLHAFIGPFSSWLDGSIKYGLLLTSPKSVIERIESNL